MLKDIKGLHHVSSMARDARKNNTFFVNTLGLRRIKQTVNFDEPSVYHLYYGDETGTPGSVMTYFPFPNIIRGRMGTGEAGETIFSIPTGSIPFWKERLTTLGVQPIREEETFGEKRLRFPGPDGEHLTLVEVGNDMRIPWTGGSVGDAEAIRGFHSVTLRLQDTAATEELLNFMNYEHIDTSKGIKRFAVNGSAGGNGADVIDLVSLPAMPKGDLGAGTVHHIAFAVDTLAQQLEVRQALLDTGYQVTPVRDRQYFKAIYFRTPGGVLFEIATNEPGFALDEEPEHLGETLQLPEKHEHMRDWLRANLAPLED